MLQEMSQRLETRILWSVLGLAVAATAVVALVPGFRVAYTAPTLKISLETAATLIATLVGYLVVGRYRMSHGGDRALVAFGMFLLAASDALILALPHLFIHGTTGPSFATWLPLGAQLVAGTALAVAATWPGAVDATAAQLRGFWFGGTAVVLLFGVLGAAVPLPADNTPAFSLSSTNPHLDFERSVSVVQIILAALFAIACIGFAARARRREPFASWLALGAGLASIAQLNFALFLSEFSRWLYTGDVIRLAAYAAWLVGAMGEISSYWQERAALAVEQERRRVARDLHDGLAQELAFIVSETRSWGVAEATAWGTNGRTQLVSSSAERALFESRRAIAALTANTNRDLESVLRRTLETVTDQFGSELRLEVDSGFGVSPPVMEDLVRIAREATTNACRHGGARWVHVVVSKAPDGDRLVVRDDGAGFVVDGPTRKGSYGLQSMAERAEKIGGGVVIRSTPGRGTDVEVRW
jgi:signal transduction histidine kinase